MFANQITYVTYVTYVTYLLQGAVVVDLIDVGNATFSTWAAVRISNFLGLENLPSLKLT